MSPGCVWPIRGSRADLAEAVFARIHGRLSTWLTKAGVRARRGGSRRRHERADPRRAVLPCLDADYGGPPVSRLGAQMEIRLDHERRVPDAGDVALLVEVEV